MQCLGCDICSTMLHSLLHEQPLQTQYTLKIHQSCSTQKFKPRLPRGGGGRKGDCFSGGEVLPPGVPSQIVELAGMYAQRVMDTNHGR